MTNVRLTQDNHKMEVRFLRASHVASGNQSLNEIVHDTYDWHVKLSFVLRFTLNRSNTILTQRSAKEATTDITRSTPMISKHGWPDVTEALRSYQFTVISLSNELRHYPHKIIKDITPGFSILFLISRLFSV